MKRELDYDNLTHEEVEARLVELDARLGPGVGAARERARLAQRRSDLRTLDPLGVVRRATVREGRGE